MFVTVILDETIILGRAYVRREKIFFILLRRRNKTIFQPTRNYRAARALSIPYGSFLMIESRMQCFIIPTLQLGALHNGKHEEWKIG